MEFLVITGLSGAGKTRVIDICEDMGYYCVDNLPIALIDRFAELCLATRGRFERVAVGLDVRASREMGELSAALDRLEAMDCGMRILFVDASDRTLVRRYKETRRPHPLAARGRTLAEAIAADRSFSEPLRRRAEHVIDTTGMSLSGLQSELYGLLAPESRYFSVSVCAFGFKYGIPPEADLVFDVRCLPNPFYQDELKELCGLDKPVADLVFGFDNSRVFRDKLMDLLAFLLPRYEEEGRRELTIGVGCTGGRHRSVAMARALTDALEAQGWDAALRCRDMERSGV